jgi:hypothetical protein
VLVSNVGVFRSLMLRTTSRRALFSGLNTRLFFGEQIDAAKGF